MPALALFGQSKQLPITAVEILQVSGHRQEDRGVDRQYQVNPLYVYDELRPKPYADHPSGETNVPVSALYLRIRTGNGPEGFYGPIDKEAAFVVEQQLRPFLLGKDALAQEKLWDQMYRSNRHSRRGHFLMAISAVDNTLWDLRGRYFQTPVYRLLGGPTRTSIEAYASCLGFSLDRLWKVLGLPGYFCILNLAVFPSLIEVLRGNRFIMWDTRRELSNDQG